MGSQQLDTPYGSINLYLNSNQATLSEGLGNSNKTWFLNSPVYPPQHTRMLVAVTDFQAANSWYLIRVGINDNFRFGEAGVNYIAIIPEGNYTSLTFLATLNGLIEVLLGSLGARMTYISASNKFVYTTIVLGNSVTVYNKANGTTCDTEVGMENSPNITATGVGFNSITFPNMINFAGIPYINVIGNSLGLENRDSFGDINLTLCKVPVKTQSLGFIYLPNSPPTYLSLEDRHIKKIQLILRDDEGNDLDFHGVSWGLTISIHFQYIRIAEEPEHVIQTKDVIKQAIETKEGSLENN